MMTHQTMTKKTTAAERRIALLEGTLAKILERKLELEAEIKNERKILGLLKQMPTSDGPPEETTITQVNEEFSSDLDGAVAGRPVP